MWFVRVWLPLVVVEVLVCGLIYASVQQNYRQSLNDPQIQIAEDAAHALMSGSVPASVVPRGVSIDISQSLATWISIYDKKGLSLESTGVLNGAPPQIPAGLFATSTWGGDKTFDGGTETRVTWQPQPGVRQAIVVVVAGDKFVVAGRNMREVEDRIWSMQSLICLGLLTMLVASLIAVWLGSKAQDFITIVRE